MAKLHFQWAESHANGKLPKPERHGFGMELLTQVLPYDLDAKTKMDFAPDGLRFSMDLPLDHVIEQQ